MRPNPQKTTDLVTFTEEILNEKLHFLCSVCRLANYSCMHKEFVVQTLLLSRHLLVRCQQWKHQNILSNLFNVNRVIGIVMVSLLLTLNKFHSFLWCFHC